MSLLLTAVGYSSADALFCSSYWGHLPS